ncbi:GNAT family N-acetyltransferase [Kineococcus rubinsiae]|uniref:GNAT family N-acetyltransferase n=1 Tax=Kineococcus rubinsiae TaxID=2609562 RepID=UPI001AD8CD08|nr:GNAT family N-acetyltransferase [Kineococcus rubinsiae]
MSVVVRPARPADAPAVAEVHVTGWQVGYRGLVEDAYLDALSVADRVGTWAQRLADGARVLVADDGRVRGFATTGPVRDDDVPAEAGEVYALYVHPKAWGRGVGGALLTAALDDLAARGHQGCVLWTLEGNARARGFYEHRGWVADGGVKTEDHRGVLLREVRYRHA